MPKENGLNSENNHTVLALDHDSARLTKPNSQIMTTNLSDRTQGLLRRTLCWDNHACMPLRPGDTTFLPQLERIRQAGISLVSLNISFDVVDPNDAIHLLATFRHWIKAHAEQYLLADTVADIKAAKSTGRLAVVFDIEGGNAVAAHPGLVEIFYRLGVRWMLLAYNKNNTLVSRV